MHPKVQDKELLRVSSLVDSLYFMGKCNEPMDSWIRLVHYLAKKKVPGFPEQGYGTYNNTYVMEALAAKAAAEAIPTFNMVDDVIRAVAEYLGRSSPWHQRFMELQEVFTSTNLEKHGPSGSPEMVVEGASSDGSLNRFKVKLHERTNPSYRGPGHHDACVALCTDMAELVVENLQSKLGDLDSLSGARLFIPDMWQPHWDRDARQAQCLEWLLSLVTLFRADEADEILPGQFICHPTPFPPLTTAP
ncbi:unnamed protein product [Closterium sp. Naga37s-1]|nr:unnamed protein product [Closterium sp. Naga37s-1]